MKTCASCKLALDLDDFTTDNQKPDGHRYTCRRCDADRKLQIKYGITLDEYEARLVSQNYGCAICGVSEHGGTKYMTRWAVDHDHVTGRVRGLLCHSCNLGLGKFKDSAQVLRRAAEYVEEGI